MNKKERQLLSYIRDNPFLTQNELAEKMNLSRSAVAGYVASLIKKGEITGRAYIIPQKKDVVCIGGSNIDRKIQVSEPIVFETSNPAKSSQSVGGVARNIAENLGRLSIDVSLISAVGDDYEGKWLLNETSKFVDVQKTQIFENEQTGTYTALLDKTGEMVVALADMNIYDRLNEELILQQWGNIVKANYVLLDTNLPKKIIKKLITRCHAESVPLCIVPVSSPKVTRLPEDMTGVTLLILNKDEAEVLTNSTVVHDKDYINAARKLIDRGVKTVVITKGKQGLMYLTKSGETGKMHPEKINVKDVTGAGDSFAAGLLYGIVNGYAIHEACEIGMIVSSITLQSDQTVSPNLTESLIKEAYEKRKQ